IGAGLAGCEAAWQIANRGVKVNLYEMKPEKKTPAHKYDNFAELVCSNSLRADGITNAVGLLKEEMRLLNSLIMQCADETKVPAGGALAVDRYKFSDLITEKINSHPNINVLLSCEITKIPDGITVIATGPLSSDAMCEEIQRITDSTEYLHFFDAAAPIVSFDTIDMNIAYKAARYGKGGDDYINCPMTKEQYEEFYKELVNAETAEVKEFENNVFEGCMPVEVMAKRGHDTLLFGPLKPVGLPRPDGTLPYAVVQLRQDNSEGSMYNLVGFQTHLKFGEQKRVFGLIPGLENAEFLRYGVMHKNTYINSPKLLDNTYRLKTDKNIFFAGQITGVEGYVESASSGLVAGINAAMAALGKPPVVFDRATAHGALAHYVSDETVKNFQPMNVNFGILPSLEERIKAKKERYEKISKKALAIIENM
ncbi:MAG: methylenetetrahydrofolate--tRNA-(uracil(54)-C(5))-methyltransferase (FADH(2)-oxidizing) TrmFO, partial [Clostridia bacterium]|nr:methylenetetrahydrofolate--tRNA-(uracil(54)-C(5))-methyltransferase (FADH(2)-oxidizing) TrmFO [Clostridia bacterium]